jgi:hypothetical protein
LLDSFLPSDGPAFLPDVDPGPPPYQISGLPFQDLYVLGLRQIDESGERIQSVGPGASTPWRPRSRARGDRALEIQAEGRLCNSNNSSVISSRAPSKYLPRSRWDAEASGDTNANGVAQDLSLAPSPEPKMAAAERPSTRPVPTSSPQKNVGVLGVAKLDPLAGVLPGTRPTRATCRTNWTPGDPGQAARQILGRQACRWRGRGFDVTRVGGDL